MKGLLPREADRGRPAPATGARGPGGRPPRALRRLVRWLYPGLRIKRWLALFTLALVLLVVGMAALLSLPSRVLLRPALAAALLAWMPPVAGATLTVAGLVLGFISVRQLVLSVVDTVAPDARGALGEALFLRRHLERGPRICAVGGGTGLSVLLRGLKLYTANLTAIVTVSDDGGSSGRLRDELGILAPGDLRNCLAALAETEPLMEQLFQYRFERGSVAGHTVGNLLLGALAELNGGDFVNAVRAASRVLAVRGRVLPATTDPVTLRAELADGRVVAGEAAIPGARGRVRRLELLPAGCRALPEAAEAILGADLVIVGPGSLYTSVLPNLLLEELRRALRETSAFRVYVLNVMTQPGETDGYTAADHLQALFDHAGPGLFDAVLCHTGGFAPGRLSAYHEQGAAPVALDRERLEAMGVSVCARPVAAADGLVRHDPELLAQALLTLALERANIPEPAHLVDYWLAYERARRGAGAGGG